MLKILLIFSLIISLICPTTAFAQTSGTDTIIVTAEVPVGPNNFEVDLISLTPGTVFNQETEITYQLTYGSTSLVPEDIVVEAIWSLGTVSGEGAPTIEILSFVDGSATEGYGGVVPVIDTVNQKISWTIPNFPASTTGQIVTFTLRTTSNYGGTNQVNFNVRGRVVSNTVQSADSVVYQSYLYKSTPGGGGDAGGPTPAPSSTPQPSPTASFTSYVKEVSISSDDAVYSVTTQPATSLVVKYGTDPKLLTANLLSPQFQNRHLLNFQNLEPDTDYYFQISYTLADGSRRISQVYKFRTAKIGGPIGQINQDSIVLISREVVLSQLPTTEPNFYALELNSPVQIKFTAQNLSSIKVWLVDESGQQFQSTQALNFGPDSFSVGLTMPSQLGFYQVKASLQDINGNLSLIDFPIQLRTVEPLSLFSNLGRPVERARVFAWYFDPLQRRYLAISDLGSVFTNPRFSSVDGQLAYILPPGQYRLQINALGYAERIVEFQLGSQPDQVYPRLELIADPFNLWERLKYYAAVMTDTWSDSQGPLDLWSRSYRVWDLVNLMVMLSLIILGFISLGTRTGDRPWHWLRKIRWWFPGPHQQARHNYLLRVRSTNDWPIMGVEVIGQSITEQVIVRGITDRFGVCRLVTNQALAQIELVKLGYQGLEITNPEPSNQVQDWQLNQKETTPASIFKKVQFGVINLLSLIFEVILVLSLVFEILFAINFGWLEALPFMLLSLINIFWWLWYWQRYWRWSRY